MQQHTLSYRQSIINYLRFGEGAELLFAFHGFGDQAAMWLKAKGLSARFTVIAFDLPFHGQTVWDAAVFSSRDFEAMVEAVLQVENKERFSLAGFSFGARIVERLFLQFKNNIDHILLFAPDGFDTKGLFHITLIPRPIRRFIARLLDRPTGFLRFLAFLNDQKLLNRFSYRFMVHHLNNGERRTRLFTYWLSMDDFVVKPERFKTQLVKSNIKTDLFFGKTDDIIPLSSGHWLAENAPNIHLHIIDDGHKLVNEKLNELLQDSLTVR